MIEIIIEFGKEILLILLATSISSFVSKKIGIIVSSLIVVGYFSLAIIFLFGGVSGSDKFLVMAVFVFPIISSIGFFIGKFFRKDRKA
jgi:ABC-type multidrug transport system permease subunit